MKFEIHKVIEEEELSEIADKYNLSSEKIKEINPEMRLFKIFGAEYVTAQQDLKIPVKKIKNGEDNLIKHQFSNLARYRCLQNNITKALENVTFSSEIKTQYLFSKSIGKEKFFFLN